MGKIPYQQDYERILLALQDIFCFQCVPRVLTRKQRRIFRRASPHLLIRYHCFLRNPPPGPAVEKSLPSITPCEIAVGTGICDGKSNKEIAADLKKSIHTVISQVRSLRHRLGVPSRAAIAKPFLAYLQHLKSLLPPLLLLNL